ncbi:MAG TPA: hypothetical protein VGF84_12715 [Micromonosporaceae bacterium]|jgi:hypothetical protein
MAEAWPLSRRGAVIVAVVALICAIGGFVLGDASGAASRRAATLASAGNAVAHTRVRPTPLTPLIRGDRVALTAHLLTLPPGARSLASTADALDVPGVNPTTLLATLGDKAVVGADWLRDDAIEVRTSLVEFTAASSANSFVYALDQQLAGTPAVTRHFSIPGISACVGDDDAGLDRSGRRISTLLCADSEVAIVMSFFTPGALDDEREIAMLQTQLDALAS